MSVLFTPFLLGKVKLSNRFVASACEDNLADEDGRCGRLAVKKYRRLAAGEVGLIISSHLAVNGQGRTRIRQAGIFNDDMLAGLGQIAGAVHKEVGKIIFQLGHAGRRLKQPDAVSSVDAYPVNLMDQASINEVVKSFQAAASRAAAAGADGVQLHAAHGYLVNQFLSPFFNHRTDKYGVTDEGRFRLLQEIILAIRTVIAPGMALLVKLNSCDYTPQGGITPSLAAAYAGRLAGLKVDGIEVSCGNSSLSPWQMCRGRIPVREILSGISEERRPHAEARMAALQGSVQLDGTYNLQAALTMRVNAADTTIFPVGGWRSLPEMENAVANGQTDLVSLCRPFIREPNLVRKFRSGRAQSPSCTSCNICLAAVNRDIPVRCYSKGLPA